MLILLSASPNCDAYCTPICCDTLIIDEYLHINESKLSQHKTIKCTVLWLQMNCGLGLTTSKRFWTTFAVQRKTTVQMWNWEGSNNPVRSQNLCFSAEQIQAARSAQMATLRSAWPLKSGVWTWLLPITTGSRCQSSFLCLVFGKSYHGMRHTFFFGFSFSLRPF